MPTTMVVPPTTATTPPLPGTRVLTEPVDPAALAVPEDWHSLSADPRTLLAALQALEPGHPLMVGVLRSEEATAAAGGIRVFAVSSSGPLTFVSLTSYASPGTVPLSQAASSLYPPKTTRAHGVATDFQVVALPVGGALQTRTVIATRAVKVAGQTDVVPINGRTILLTMGTEAAALPPVFSQIESSLRAG